MKHIINDPKAIFNGINQAALQFLKPLSLQQTYATIANESKNLFTSKGAFIILKDRDAFQTVYSTMHFSDTIKPRKKGFIYNTIKNNKVLLLQRKDFQDIHPEITGILSSLFIPLTYENVTIGVLLLHFEDHITVEEEHFHMLKLFGSMASLAIKNAHLHAEMKQALETRDLFISLASHELKTPLTSINIYSQLLKKRLAITNTSEAKWADRLATETNQLTLLTNELLQVDQIKTSAFQYQIHNCDLIGVIKRAITNISFVYPSSSFKFINNTKMQRAYIMGDANKLLQVLLNLLSNAAKFSPLDENINITLTYDNNEYLIQVSDKGKGIPQEEVKKIFERFYKGSNNYKEGMGLGLFLTKRIIEDHNGKISVSSELGKGTTFAVCLPKTQDE